MKTLMLPVSCLALAVACARSEPPAPQAAPRATAAPPSIEDRIAGILEDQRATFEQCASPTCVRR